MPTEPTDPSTGDPSTGDPSTGDPSTGDPSAGDPVAGEEPVVDENTPPPYEPPATQRRSMEQLAVETREFLRDKSQKNTLLMGELEHDWQAIYSALESAFLDWNAAPPISQYTFETIDYRAYPMIIRRAVVELLESAAQKQQRNQLSYNDQGFAVTENDKAQAYVSLSNQLRRQYNQDRDRLKAAINMDTYWGGVHHDAYEQTEGDWPFGVPFGETF